MGKDNNNDDAGCLFNCIKIAFAIYLLYLVIKLMIL
jgi:hypothetical protein